MGNTQGMGLLRENMTDILQERNKNNDGLFPKDDINAIELGLMYSYDVKINKVSQEKFTSYFKKWGIDSRYKGKILVTKEENENLKGFIFYKKRLYKFIITKYKYEVEEIPL